MSPFGWVRELVADVREVPVIVAQLLADLAAAEEWDAHWDREAGKRDG